MDDFGKKLGTIIIILIIFGILWSGRGVLSNKNVTTEEIISVETKVECNIEKGKGECIREYWGDCDEWAEGPKYYEKVLFEHTNPTCECFRIDSTIKIIEDMADISWDGEKGINVEWRDFTFEEEMDLRETNEWKCKCTFDYQLGVNGYNEEVCNIVTIKKIKVKNTKVHTEYVDYWFDEYEYNVESEREDREVGEETRRTKLLVKPISKSETVEKIFTHKIM